MAKKRTARPKAARKKAKPNAPPPADESKPEHVQQPQPDTCAGCAGTKSASTCLCGDCWARLPLAKKQAVTEALEASGQQSQAYRTAVAAAVYHVARVHLRRQK